MNTINLNILEFGMNNTFSFFYYLRVDYLYNIDGKQLANELEIDLFIIFDELKILEIYEKR